MKQIVHVLGGGTFSHVRCHLAIAAPAFGETAKRLDLIIAYRLMCQYDIKLTLTAMAGGNPQLVTNEDVSNYVQDIVADPLTKVIVFNVALVDFNGEIDGVPSGKYADRLQSREGPFTIKLTTADKVIADIKAKRPDIILVGFKTTSGDTSTEQINKARRLIQQTNADIVLANDTVTRRNQVVTANDISEATHDRSQALQALRDKLVELLNQHATENV